jgi:predicted aminopeptidase
MEMNANEPIDPVVHGPRASGERRKGSEQARAIRRASRRVALPAADSRVAEVMSGVARRIAAQPLESLAIALTVGFALGGALSFRAGRFALRIAARRAGRELLKQFL